jgi:hypothetical protein
MLLRSISKHVKDQNWFAVGLDFFIVVVGVFIGIQVANWNEQQTFNARETNLLYELRKEAEAAIALTNEKLHAYQQVTAAGKRSLDFLSSNESCGTECWPVLVDFMHASQWQSVAVPRSTYDNMRRLGLPKNSAIVEATEAYLLQNDSTFPAFGILPYYRSLVRQLVPLDAQGFYWLNCYILVDGVETYDLNCPKGVTDDMALKTVEAISQHAEIKPHLIQWISSIVIAPVTFASQVKTTERAIAAIDAELQRR